MADNPQEKASVWSRCDNCRGTGVFVRLDERERIGYVCSFCEGTGKRELKYRPFTGLTQRDDVDNVASGKSHQPWKGWVTYERFLAGQMPT